MNTRVRQLAQTAYRVLQSEGIIGLIGRFGNWIVGKRGYFRLIPPEFLTYQAFCDRFLSGYNPLYTELGDNRSASHSPTSTITFAVVVYPVSSVSDEEHYAQTVASIKAQSHPQYTIHMTPSAPIPIRCDAVLPILAGDQLAPYALTMFAKALVDHPDADLFYGDRDCIHPDGERSAPWFKPPPTPENLISRNPFAGGCVFRWGVWSAQAAKKPASQAIQLVDQGKQAIRIPTIVIHRQTTHDEVFAPVYLRKRYQTYAAELNAGRLRWTPQHNRHITIIIPTHDQPDLLERCLKSIFQYTQYPQFDVTLIDHQTHDPQALDVQKHYQRQYGVQIVPYHAPFNFSRACNLGAAGTTGELLLFLNNDVECLSVGWLTRMAQWFDVLGVGIVGAMLHYPDGRVQHGGVGVGVHGCADNLFAGADSSMQTPYGAADWYRNWSAVTGACLMIDRRVYEAVGGFDESYQLIYSDVQLCVDVIERGYRVVYTPDVELIHHESATHHQRRLPQADVQLASQRLRGYLEDGDPHYHPLLTTRWHIPHWKIDPHDTSTQFITSNVN